VLLTVLCALGGQMCQVYDSAECCRNVHSNGDWRQAAGRACQVREQRSQPRVHLQQCGTDDDPSTLSPCCRSGHPGHQCLLQLAVGQLEYIEPEISMVLLMLLMLLMP